MLQRTGILKIFGALAATGPRNMTAASIPRTLTTASRASISGPKKV